MTPRKDIEVLRRLAERKAALCDDPVNAERRRAWHALDAGENHRVMLLAEHDGIRDPNKPVDDSTLECADPWARGVEQSLRSELYVFETLKDDHVLEPFFNVNWPVTKSGYGVEVAMHHAEAPETSMGARRWDPPVKDLDKDFSKLRPRTFSVDREGLSAAKKRLEAVFAGILDVRIRGAHYWTMGLTWPAIELVGLENFMVFMYDNPEGLHRLMSFLRDDHLNFAAWIEAEGLYTLNNENDYIGSGSMGYTTALPRPGWKPGQPVKTTDLWVLLESQETVGVGPEQFAEFVFPYQKSIAERFGLTYYGCCEPVHNRWHIIEKLPNLARVSVSPWADQEFMAQALGGTYVFSRKPNPTLISTSVFDERAIRADIRNTLDIAGECRLEIIMKDVHTLNNEPERLARWVALARDEIEKQ